MIPEQYPSAKKNPMIRVAIVDDNPAFRDALHFILKREPDLSVVAVAGDGLAAIEIAEQHHPDVMLVDVRLPKMDGLEATRIIASKHPQTRVIVLSLFMDDGTRVNALKEGAYRYLSKESNRREILAAIRDGHQPV